MKTRFVSLKRAWLLMLALAGLSGVEGQTGKITWMSGCSQCDTSIVREWKNGYSLLYSHRSGCGHQFCIIDQAGMPVASVMTQSVVKDMEIINDTAYFCGKNSGGSPIVGSFDINGILSGSLQEKHVVMGCPFSGGVVTPRRVEAFHVIDGVHFVTVVDIRFASGAVKRSLVDVYKTYPATNWSIVYAAYSSDENDNVFYCDDVAVTDNYVFVSGHKRTSAGIYMRKFEKPTCAGFLSCTLHDIMCYSGLSPIYNDVYYYDRTSSCPWINVVGDGRGEHAVYCTHTEGDKVAIACFASRDDMGISVDTLGFTIKDIDVASMTLISDVFLSYSSITLDNRWDVRDVRYDHVNKEVLVLHDGYFSVDGTIGSAVTFVDYPAFTSRSTIYPLIKFYQYSVDKFTYLGTAMVSAGYMDNTGHEMAIGINERHYSTCFGEQKLPIKICIHKINNFEVRVLPFLYQAFPNNVWDSSCDEPTEPLCE